MMISCFLQIGNIDTFLFVVIQHSKNRSLFRYILLLMKQMKPDQVEIVELEDNHEDHNRVRGGGTHEYESVSAIASTIINYFFLGLDLCRTLSSLLFEVVTFLKESKINLS